MVSALELLAGIEGVSAERFPEAKTQIGLAYDLSKGRVLEDPTFLLCNEVLRAPFPTKLGRPDPDLIADYLQIVCCAKSLEEIHTGRVQVRKLRTMGGGRAGATGFGASVIKELVDGPKREWVERSETFAGEIYPQWREHLRQTGTRVPDKMRDRLKSRQTWDTEKAKFTESKLEWLEVSTTPELITEITKRLDAALEFTIFVVREMLLGNYNLEKHDSDVYDQFQLHYLALDRPAIVTEDRDLPTRTARSSQAGRIVSFREFLLSL
jgi:hypothetical protein